MHRLTKKQLRNYKRRLEADKKAYGLVVRITEKSHIKLASSKPSILANKTFDAYLNRVVLRHLARLYEYDKVLERLAGLD